MMEEGIDVTGIPGPNPMLGCGMILFVVGVVTTIAISGYLLFKVSLILQILFYGIFCNSSWHYTHCIMFKSRKSW